MSFFKGNKMSHGSFQSWKQHGKLCKGRSHFLIQKNKDYLKDILCANKIDKGDWVQSRDLKTCWLQGGRTQNSYPKWRIHVAIENGAQSFQERREERYELRMFFAERNPQNWDDFYNAVKEDNELNLVLHLKYSVFTVSFPFFFLLDPSSVVLSSLIFWPVAENTLFLTSAHNVNNVGILSFLDFPATEFEKSYYCFQTIPSLVIYFPSIVLLFLFLW